MRMEIIIINNHHPGESLSCVAGVGARELHIVLCIDQLMWSLLFSMSKILLFMFNNSSHVYDAINHLSCIYSHP